MKKLSKTEKFARRQKQRTRRALKEKQRKKRNVHLHHLAQHAKAKT